MADKVEALMFDGEKLTGVEFELGGGGTARDTDVVLHKGDVVRGWFTAKVVNVKFPAKAETRRQTLNIQTAGISEILEKYVAPEPQPTLEDAAAAAKK